MVRCFTFSKLAGLKHEHANAVSVSNFFSRPNSMNLMEMNGVINSTGDQAVGKVTWPCLCMWLNFQLELCLY